MLLVLDASVVAKWFKEEEYTSNALKIREGFCRGIHEVVIPDLLLYEISNVLRYDKKFNKKIIAEIINSILDMNIDITIPFLKLISDAVSMAYERNITVYDAIYVVLARNINGIFITADKTLYEKIKNLKFVKLISQL